MVWLDRNSSGKPAAACYQDWYDRRVLRIRKLAHLIPLALGLHKDVVDERLYFRSSKLFPTVYSAPVAQYFIEHIETANNRNREIFMQTCQETADLQDAAASATDRRSFVCLKDRLGCVPELLAIFAEACHENPFSMLFVFTLKDVVSVTYDEIGVSSLQEWRELCEAGGYLVLWTTDTVVVRVESEDLSTIMMQQGGILFEIVIHLLLKPKRDRKARVNAGRSERFDTEKQDLYPGMWRMYSITRLIP
jgi:hypothetical protein